MRWFNRSAIGFFGVLSLLWLGQLMSSGLSLCEVRPGLASPLFILEAATSRYHAPFLMGLFLCWLSLSAAEARIKQTPIKDVLQGNLSGVFALLTWLAFPLFKPLYALFWGLAVWGQRRRQRGLTLPTALTTMGMLLLLAPPAWACLSPLPSTQRNAQQLQHMLRGYKHVHGNYPVSWRAFEQANERHQRFQVLQNPYQPMAPAVMDYARLKAPRLAADNEIPLANRHVDFAGFRWYLSWWKNPNTLPRDQGTLVYRYLNAEQGYKVYGLSPEGKLIAF